MGMMALGREDLNGQLRVAEQGGIQPLVRLLRIPRTSSQVLLADVCALASLCIGQYGSISHRLTERLTNRSVMLF